MNIYKTQTIGFCFGVKRAVDGMIELLENNDPPVYCLGELIHNEEMSSVQVHSCTKTIHG